MDTIKELDSKHHLSPMSDWKTLLEEGGRRIITKGEGIYVWDSTGKCYTDGMSGLWCVNLGYSNDDIKTAIKEQLEVLPYYNSFFKTSNEPAAELSKLLATITPSHINHFFYGCSGSDANDTIFKIVRRYWANKKRTSKKIFISRKNAYHGSTVLSATLGGMEPMHQLNDLVIKDIVHINQPYTFDAGVPYNDAEFGLKLARELEDKILELGAENVAAFIGEPIQGAGGVIIPPDSYWPEVARICKQYEVLLISDEVICGFGRTGKWFGFEHNNIMPDIITTAKGINSGYVPLSAVGVSDEVYNGLISQAKEFSHGYTYSAHPLACRAAVANIAYMQKHHIIEHINKDIAPHFHALGRELMDYPLVGEVRFRGLLMAIELVKNKNTRERFEQDIGIICRDIAINNGLIMRACRHSMVLAPPFVITKQELDEIFQTIYNVLDQTMEAAKKIN